MGVAHLPGVLIVFMLNIGPIGQGWAPRDALKAVDKIAYCSHLGCLLLWDEHMAGGSQDALYIRLVWPGSLGILQVSRKMMDSRLKQKEA